MTSRDEVEALRGQLAELAEKHVRLEREHHRLRCEYRRVCEAHDWSLEQIRVLRRVIERLAASP